MKQPTEFNMRTIGAAIGATLLCMGFAFAAEPVHHSASQTASDTRQPLYLLPVMAQHQKQNMREHLAAVNEIVAALGKNDFKSVGEAARKLGTTPEMQQMCAHMGA
ncbi:MAG TPA: hypothetical protein VFS13_21630, partial [Steroidobacteraceae bacterium]|nr:hypothetical protein [Steroidobacteraceae bacterium]